MSINWISIQTIVLGFYTVANCGLHRANHQIITLYRMRPRVPFSRRSKALFRRSRNRSYRYNGIIDKSPISQKLIRARRPIASLNNHAKRFSGARDFPNICTSITRRCTQYRWINISASVSRGLSHLLAQTLFSLVGLHFPNGPNSRLVRQELRVGAFGRRKKRIKKEGRMTGCCIMPRDNRKLRIPVAIKYDWN